MTYSYPRRSPSPFSEPYPRALDPRFPAPAPNYRDRYDRDRPPPRRSGPPQLQEAEPNNVLGVFGLSIRTRERDLEDEFMRYGDVEKVVIVYDQRTDRSRGFGFITMRTIEDASRAIEKLNGLSLHGRNIRVDYSATQKPHAPTPGQYMGVKRPTYEDRYDDRRGYDSRSRGYDSRYNDRGGYDSRSRGYDGRGGGGGYDGRSRGYDRPPRDDRDRYADRDDRGRRDYDDRPKRDEYDDRRRSPSPRRRYSASPDRGSRAARDYESASGAGPAGGAPEAPRY
uniref:RRM domain-containing protein n=1 Tax=Kwoniella bestiolae CBS 10118 TaxID=1296100 RepID=A0A1B9G2A9_9TREE|nr:hypothetical protein I302_04966 [Kwoniella bestiolae CBS 10118]OCF25156.1 hypothetical protein I302_04966 [Kwoniella bestiolae CBS 10118]